jgi:hypothetical protein
MPSGVHEEFASNTIGAAIAVIASAISILGTNTQKRSHNNELLLPQHLRKPYTSRALWWLGLSGVIVGAIGDFVALGYASQALVSALGE